MSFDLQESWLNWIVTLGAIAGLVATYFRGVITQNERITKGFIEQDKRIHELQLEMRTTKVQLEVFLQVINKELPKALVSPHTPEIDEYMWKRMKGEPISEEEKKRAFELMQEVINGQLDIDDGGQSKDFRAAYAIQMASLAAELAREEERKKAEADYIRQKQELESKLEEIKKKKWWQRLSSSKTWQT